MIRRIINITPFLILILMMVLAVFTVCYFSKDSYVDHSQDTAIFFGDSVAYGYATEGKGYGFYVNEYLHFKDYKNAAKNNAVYNTLTQGENNIITQINDNSANYYDYIILEGGYGDLRDVPKLGKLNKIGNSDYDTETFAGAVDYALDLATHIWKDSKIGVIISYNTPENHNGIRDNYDETAKYWQILKEACVKWHVSYLDLFSGTVYDSSDGKIKTFNKLLKVTDTEYLDKDMIHLNEKGYKLLAKYISIWINTL